MQPRKYQTSIAQLPTQIENSMFYFFFYLEVIKVQSIIHQYTENHAKSRVRRSLSADFAGGRLASVFPSPDPTHVGASGAGSAPLFTENQIQKA